MSVDSIISELRSIYRELEDPAAPVAKLGKSDIERWSVGLGVPRAKLYDILAIRLASGFYQNELSYEICDCVVNDIHGIISLMKEDRPDIFWSVYLAFDAGEYYHNNNRAEDPVETYTRPLIAQIIEKYGLS